MDKTKVVKFFLGVVVSAGATKIVGGFVRNNTCPTSLRDKITIVVATAVIVSMTCRVLNEHAHKMVDETVDAWNEMKERILQFQAELAGED